MKNKKIRDHLGNKYSSKQAMCDVYKVKLSIFNGRIKLGWTLEEALCGKKVVDHLGNEYSSKQMMCDAYEVKLTIFTQRINNGWTLEEALCGKKVVDHLGNKYSSAADMCKAYNVRLETYQKRIRKGFSVKEALTFTKNDIRGTVQKDHLGRVFDTLYDMCDYYKINIHTYYDRKGRGWTLEEILCGGKVMDHLGNRYVSKKAMCDAYKITITLFDSRIKKEWSLEEALCGKKEEMFYDHLGNAYLTQKAMCDAYKITPMVFRDRVEFGWDLKSALTTPIKNKNAKICVDHLGNEFISVLAMCKAYEVSYITFYNRRKQGYSLEESLTGKNVARVGVECEDHLGNKFSTIKAMCAFYKISYETYNGRIDMGWSLEEALTIPKNMYIGEKRVMDILNRKNILYFHDVTFGYVLEILGLGIDYDEFIKEFQIVINEETNYNWSIDRIKRLRPDFVLYRDDITAITGVIEFDGTQHQNFVEYFFKTIEKFLERNEADYVKNSLWEYLNIPMLRIRDDQIDLISDMVDDFLAYPENYITRHNTYLTEKEYWAPLTDNYGDLNIAFSF